MSDVQETQDLAEETAAAATHAAPEGEQVDENDGAAEAGTEPEQG